MKNRYMMGLMCAFCFGVLGKTALDAVGYEVVGPATAEVAGMNSRDLSRDRDFRRAVESIVYDTASVVIYDVVPGMIEDCNVWVDGEYGNISC
jgi:hypothetical protein